LVAIISRYCDVGTVWAADFETQACKRFFLFLPMLPKKKKREKIAAVFQSLQGREIMIYTSGKKAGSIFDCPLTCPPTHFWSADDFQPTIYM
jgi:hypothetical protein